MGGKKRKKAERIILLIRKLGAVPYWQQHSTHRTAEEAAKAHRSRISGRGITAWSWWGPKSEADKMLADPDYKPKGDD